MIHGAPHGFEVSPWTTTPGSRSKTRRSTTRSPGSSTRLNSPQLFNLHESPERGYFEASGTAVELALRCADWFESLLSRPVVRVEWPSAAGAMATRWEFADTGEALVISRDVPTDGTPPAHRFPVRP
jgi:hypothetical protein